MLINTLFTFDYETENLQGEHAGEDEDRGKNEDGHKKCTILTLSSDPPARSLSVLDRRLKSTITLATTVVWQPRSALTLSVLLALL